MLFTSLIILFPAVSLASWLPFKPRQASNADNCTFVSTLPPVTMTSIFPTSTIGSQSQVTGGGSLIYTTAFPTLGPDGPNLHTYTITTHCDQTPCQRPTASDYPPGFIAATVVCHDCGEQAITTVLTLPVESTPAAQASAGGDPHKDGDTYPNIHRHSGLVEPPKSPASSTNAAPQMTTVDAPRGRPTGAEAEGESDSASSASYSGPALPSIVVTDFAPGSKINGATLVKAAIFAGVAFIIA